MYDSGLHVPFIVRWPGTLEANTTTDRMVSFVDFAPTVLSIAGVKPAQHMQGAAFLGKHESKPRTHIFAARDRMDERYDTIRAARDIRYKYIRNYQPDKPYDQYVSYCESWPIMQELRRMHEANRLNDAQRLFFRSTKPLEELYDTQTDPHELNNLAASMEHREQIDALRDAMDNWLSASNDLGFVPETELDAYVPARRPVLKTRPGRKYRVHESARDAAVFGRPLTDWLAELNSGTVLRRHRAIATIRLCEAEIGELLTDAVEDSDVGVAHWAAIGSRGAKSHASHATLMKALQHRSLTVNLAAARGLIAESEEYQGIAGEVALNLIRQPDIFVRLAAAQILETVEPKTEEIRAALVQAKDDKSDPRDYVADVARHALGLPPQH